MMKPTAGRIISLISILFLVPIESRSQIVITLAGTNGSRDMTVTLAGSSWTSDAVSASAFTYGSPNVANSSHASLSGSTREGMDDINASGNPFNAAVSTGFTNGQYVPLDNPIPMTASSVPNSFSLIGFLLDDDGDSGGLDDFRLVTDQDFNAAWPNPTTFSFTGGSSSTLALNAGIGSTFDQALNIGTYTLDRAVVGSLVITAVPEPNGAVIVLLVAGSAALGKRRAKSHQSPA